MNSGFAGACLIKISIVCIVNTAIATLYFVKLALLIFSQPPSIFLVALLTLTVLVTTIDALGHFETG